MLGNFASADIFKKNNKKKSFMNTIRVSNCLDPDQVSHSRSKPFAKAISRHIKLNCVNSKRADTKAEYSFHN